jgi:hypothetical protein
MAQSHIITELDLLLFHGITTKAQTVSLLVAVRKLLEQQEVKKQYEYLTFHCDWALHPKLSGRTAQKILKMFDAANVHLKKDDDLRNLPPDLQREIESISRMTCFEQELTQFLETNGLSSLNTNRSDGFAHFLHLYAKVVEGSPLVMTKQNESASIASVTIHADLVKASRHDGGNMLLKVNWTVLDKNGQSGNFWVIHSFSLNPNATPAPSGLGGQS